MVKTISSRSSSRVSEQVDDQGMRDGKGVHRLHTIRDSCGMTANMSMVR